MFKLNGLKFLQTKPALIRVGWIVLGAIGTILLSASISLMKNPAIAIIIMLGAALFLLGLIRPHLFVIIVFLTRSVLDIFQEKEVVAGLNLAALMALMIIVVGILYFITRKTALARIPLVPPYFLFLWTCMLSFLVSSNLYISVSDLLRLFSVLIFYALAFDLSRGPREMQKYGTAILVSSIIPFIIGCQQFFAADKLFSMRPYSTFIVINAYAYYLVFVLLLIMYLAGQIKNKKINTMLGMYSVLLFVSLFLTSTRGAIISFVLSGLLLYYLVGHTANKLLLATVLLIVMVVAAFPGSVISDLLNLSRIDTLASRFRVWDIGMDLYMAKNTNKLLGIGLGIFNSGTFVGDTGVLHRGAHNDFLRILVETGIFGLLMYIVFVVYTFRFIFRRYIFTSDPQNQKLLALAIVVLVAQTIGSLTNNMVGAPALQLYIWGIVGIALGPTSQASQKRVVISAAGM
jgi:hypothetical protein